MSNLDSALQPGQIFDQYSVVRLLGRGGMGDVYEVKHEALGTRHAIKVIHSEMASKPGVIDRFLREGRAMAGLSHRGIVMVDNFGKTDGHYWFRMELMKGREVEGQSLITLEDYVMAKGGILPETEVNVLLKEMLEALAHAQEKGLVHRDLKPANVLFSGAQVKIADFGIVSAAGADWMETQARNSMLVRPKDDTVIDSSPAGTSSQALMGTYAYMSPEQKNSLAVDHRTDLYSMGLMTFRILTGHDRPSFRPPSQMVEGISHGWDNWLQRALEEDPNDRFSSAREMLESFLDFSQSDLNRKVFSASIESPSIFPQEVASPSSENESRAIPSSEMEPVVDSLAEQSDFPQPKGRNKLFMALAIALIVIVGLIVFLVNQPKKESSKFARNSTTEMDQSSELVPKTTWRDLHAERFDGQPSLVSELTRRRKAMIARMIEAEGGFFNEQVLDAMSTIPMELFCPAEQIDYVYGDRPIPIGYEETVSQPSLTAFMLTVLEVKKGDKVLELKTASGYQTALLALLGAEVYSLETDLALGRVMSPTLNNLGFDNLHYVVGGDAYAGLPKNGLYDKIIATAAYPSLPRVLFEQLKSGGRIIAPVGDPTVGQSLMLYTKTLDGELKQLELLPVAFSPMPR